MTTNESRVLYLLGSAAPPVLKIADVVTRARADGWDVCLGLTPMAARWLGDQLSELEALTGRPVRSDHILPGVPNPWPEADVAILAPGTFNTINQWALGLADTFVTSFLAQSVARGTPTVALPCVNTAHARHVQFERSVEALRSMEVSVLYGGEDGFVPQPHGQGHLVPYPWDRAFAEAERLLNAERQHPVNAV
ncbi:flavoprotein [Streptomyces sp. 4N509B]|uniref:flavoprotein n=1 Tax=Streptomyces sp. 4N509B TaxID=3457413 RepID=UPI003FD65652